MPVDFQGGDITYAEIIIRGDAGFAIPAIYECCEEEELGNVIGLI